MKINMKINSDFVFVEEMKESDIDAVLEIQTANQLSEWTFSDYKKLINEENYFKFAAKLDQKVIGFLIGRLIIQDNFHQSSFNFANEAEIYNIGVSNSHKRAGVGTGLLKSLFENRRFKPIRTVWLEVRKSNITAIEFYKKNNFTENGIRKNYYQNPCENAQLMKLEC